MCWVFSCGLCWGWFVLFRVGLFFFFLPCSLVSDCIEITFLDFFLQATVERAEQRKHSILFGLQSLEEVQNDVAVVYLLPDLGLGKPKYTALFSFGLVFVWWCKLVETKHLFPTLAYRCQSCLCTFLFFPFSPLFLFTALIEQPCSLWLLLVHWEWWLCKSWAFAILSCFCHK